MFIIVQMFCVCVIGPWHSDSALDRNVDAGEDSYVKKIISSNEGINFNKDIAEAGGKKAPYFYSSLILAGCVLNLTDDGKNFNFKTF